MNRIAFWALIGTSMILLLESARMYYDAPQELKHARIRPAIFGTAIGITILLVVYILNS